MSYTAEQLSEREFALREAEANDAEERYFEARPVDDGAMHRRSFRAGFERAWFTRGRAHADLLDWKARIEAAQGEDVREVVRKLRLGGNCLSVKQVQLDQEAADLLESLSVKLAEREAEVARMRVDIVAAIDGQPCPTPEQWRRMQMLINERLRRDYPEDEK